MLTDNDPTKLDALLDSPLPSEMTAEDKQRAQMKRVADANRAAVAALTATARMRRS